MALRLNGSSSGYVELDVPAAAGSRTLTLPDGGGSSGQYLQTDGSGALSWQTVADTNTNLTRGTNVASTSGIAVQFTGISSDVKRITLALNQVSATGGAHWIQIGDSGGFETSGYAGGLAYAGPSMSTSTNTAAWEYNLANDASIYSGHITVSNVTGNTWVCSGIVYRSNDGYAWMFAGSKTLSGTLDRIRITTSTGSDTFDAGNVNIFTEV